MVFNEKNKAANERVLLGKPEALFFIGCPFHPYMLSQENTDLDFL